jgi:hypothetical protein
VSRDLPGADEGVADEERDGGEAVEDGVERGEKGRMGAGGRGGMNIDKPEEKEGGGGADEENGGDGWGRAGAGCGGGCGGGHVFLISYCGKNGLQVFFSTLSPRQVVIKR